LTARDIHVADETSSSLRGVHQFIAEPSRDFFGPWYPMSCDTQVIGKT